VQSRQKTTKLLVNEPSNGNGWALNELLNGDPRMPVVKQTGGFPVQLGYTHPMSFRICHRVPAKKRASVAPLGSFAQLIVKAGQHNVVLVEDVYAFPSRALNAPVPNARQTMVLWFAMNCNPVASDPANQFRRIAVKRTIIHHLDLHLFRPGILL